MSYQQGGQYQQQPNQGYQNPQYGQAPPNGGQQFGQHAHQPQYPGQHTYPSTPAYGAPGAPPQQTQSAYPDTYVPQRHASNAQYPGQPQYQQQPYSYNPQHFAQPLAQPQPASIPSYNPQSYASPIQPSYPPQQYNPQHYSPASPFPDQAGFTSATSGPMGDPYGYGESSYIAQGPGYGQSPQRPSFSPAQSQSPYVPSHGYGYTPQQSASPGQSYGGYAPPSSNSPQAHHAPYPPSDYRPHSQGISSSQAPSHQYYSSSSTYPGAQDDYQQPSPPTYQQPPSPLYHTDSQVSLPTPPSTGPTPPSHGPTRSGTTGRHPQSRPLPGPPEPDAGHDYFHNPLNNRSQLSLDEQERLTQEDLFQQVESAVYNAGRTEGHSPAISVSQPPTDGGATPLYAPSSPNIARNGSVVNGHLSPATAHADPQYSSDSDAEASHGLAMLAMAEEDDRRRQSGSSQIPFSSGYGSQRSSRHHHLMPQPEASDSDDYGAVDMASYGGGYDVHMTYGGDPSVLAAGGDINGYDAYGQGVSSQNSSMRRSHASQSSQASRDYRGYDYGMDSIHPFPAYNPEARIDVGGTGGLSQPSADGRRQSYDEGDEEVLLDGHVPDRFPDEPPDIFYQPASTSYRPLPAVPGYLPPVQTDFDQAIGGAPPYPTGNDTYYSYAQSQYVPRSASLVSHTTQPQVNQPSRSQTDAAEARRLRTQQNRNSQLSTIEAGATPALTPAVDLPNIPNKRFIPSQLGAPAFNKCEEPWSLMSILKWLLQVTKPEQATEIREAELKEALVLLFTNKVPTMNIADAENLSNRVVLDMYEAETLVATEEWVKIMPGQMQGVIFQLAGTGCYAPTLHDHIVPGRCYSHHCQRTLKKVNLREQPVRTGESWAEFYKLKKEDWEGKDKRELERQNVLHEIVQTEDGFMLQLNVLRSLYRDGLAKVEPSIITPKRKEKFLSDVFGKVDAIKQANEDHLLPQLKYRQQEQGPWIVGFSDIFRQWIRKAKAAYIDYAGGFPGATFVVRQEIDRNIEFRNFVDKARNDKRSNKLGWDTFLKAPITRLQRYTLLLSTVLKTMKNDSEEKTNLKLAFDEVRSATLECDARVAEMQRKVDMADLARKLVLRSSMKRTVELNLDHFGRELIHRGDLQRMGGNRFTFMDSHAILFDHYLVIAKTVAQRTEQAGKIETYDVSRLPIPMDLLILDSTNDPAVQKRDYVKGITSVRDVAGRTGTPSDISLAGRTNSTQSSAPSLQSVNTSSSGASLQTVTSLSEGKDADRIMYPFKVKHLGRETYQLFAPTEQARRDWVVKIIEAKTKHAASLHNQNSEPFKLRVMADSAFVYDAFAGSANKTMVIKGTPVDRAIKEVEQRFKDSGRPGPICRARVNCATTFNTPYPGKEMVAVGTEYGVYISEIDNPRGWTKVSGNVPT